MNLVDKVERLDEGQKARALCLIADGAEVGKVLELMLGEPSQAIRDAIELCHNVVCKEEECITSEFNPHMEDILKNLEEVIYKSRLTGITDEMILNCVQKAIGILQDAEHLTVVAEMPVKDILRWFLV